MIKCERCRFWKRDEPRRFIDGEGDPTELAANFGECRRNAPTNTEEPWPSVRSIDWCGEYRGPDAEMAQAMADAEAYLAGRGNDK